MEDARSVCIDGCCKLPKYSFPVAAEALCCPKAYISIFTFALLSAEGPVNDDGGMARCDVAYGFIADACAASKDEIFWFEAANATAASEGSCWFMGGGI